MSEAEQAIAFLRATREVQEVRAELALIDQELERAANALLPLMQQLNARVRPNDTTALGPVILPEYLAKYFDASALQTRLAEQEALIKRRSSLEQTIKTVSCRD